MSLASLTWVLVVEQAVLVIDWMFGEGSGQPPSWIVPLSLVMLKLGRLWLLVFGVMLRHQLFCSGLVEMDRVPLLVGVNESVFVGVVPVLALAASSSVLACFRSDFRAASLSDLVMTV